MNHDFERGNLVRTINNNKIGTVESVSTYFIYVDFGEEEFVGLFWPHELRKIVLVGPENDR